MPSDLSRLTFDPKKHYSSVRLQQGRVLLDADWNEQSDIQQYRSRTESKDVIGKTGVPKEKVNSFLIDFQGDDLSIQPGRIYVGGLLCELETEASYFNQPYYPNPDNQHFDAIAYAFLSPPASPPFSPPESPPGSPPEIDYLDTGSYLIYIDAWEREINHLDDPDIREIALGEADTTTRLQTVWQVRLKKVEEGQTLESTWAEIIKTPDGKLSAHTSELEQTEDPCILPAGAGYQRLENQLYRVEIHRGGDWETATIKWSRDNATVETKIESINTIEVDEDAANAKSDRTLVVANVGKDAVLGFAGGQWVEIVDEDARLNQNDNPDSPLFELLQIASVDPANREIVLKDVPTSVAYKKGLKLRRWDMPQEAAATNGLPISDISIKLEGGVEVQVTESNIKLEGGIEVQLTDSNYRRGDYWLIPARTAIGDIEWPKTEGENGELTPTSLAPVGVQHHYGKLAVLRVDTNSNELPKLEDCRPKFPALTAIAAEDVAYDSGNCIMHSATTVQQALDNLCQVGNSIYTHIAIPSLGWEGLFESIDDNEEGAQRPDAHIGFPVGEYPLEGPVRISNKRNLTLTGSGLSTRITAPDSESTLIFENCESVTIRDLYAETGLAGYLSERNKGLNGTLMFLNCKSITIEGVKLKCGAGSRKSVTCITIRNEEATPSTLVRIETSEFNIGHYQQGILVINAKQTLIQDNSLNTYDIPEWMDFEEMLRKDKMYRADVRGLFISHYSPIRTEETNVRLDNRIHFKTLPGLTFAWQELYAENPPTYIHHDKHITRYLNNIIDKILLNRDFRERYGLFDNNFNHIKRRSPVSVAKEGITIAGSVPNDIRVLNNKLDSVLKGIHIGIYDNAGESALATHNCHISGNFIKVFLPSTISISDRCGIYVNTRTSLLIEKNTIALLRHPTSSEVEIQGIIIKRAKDTLLVTQNRVSNLFFREVGFSFNSRFSIGIKLPPYKPSGERWTVIWNTIGDILETDIWIPPGATLDNTP